MSGAWNCFCRSSNAHVSASRDEVSGASKGSATGAGIVSSSPDFQGVGKKQEVLLFLLF